MLESLFQESCSRCLQIYYKRDCDIFLWILRNLSKHLFNRTPLDHCFCKDENQDLENVNYTVNLLNLDASEIPLRSGLIEIFVRPESPSRIFTVMVKQDFSLNFSKTSFLTANPHSCSMSLECLSLFALPCGIIFFCIKFYFWDQKYLDSLTTMFQVEACFCSSFQWPKYSCGS